VSESRPAIAIVTPVIEATFGVWNQPAALLPAGYVAGIQRAGGLALLITPERRLVQEPDELLDRVDGLLLSGGHDMDPAAYGADRHEATNNVDPLRDAFEIALTRRAVQRDMPVLGICRGIQVLNVAFGGTLHQHLPESVGHEDHRRVPGSFDGADHDVRLTPGSLAALAAGELVHATKSHHHQGVDRIGERLVVTGTSVLDDLPEALELPEHRFVLGVQWHPEADDRSRVVAALVQAAMEYRAARDEVAAA
jgi:putative glutamine amidotransferase